MAMGTNREHIAMDMGMLGDGYTGEEDSMDYGGGGGQGGADGGGGQSPWGAAGRVGDGGGEPYREGKY